MKPICAAFAGAGVLFIAGFLVFVGSILSDTLSLPGLGVLHPRDYPEYSYPLAATSLSLGILCILYSRIVAGSTSRLVLHAAIAFAILTLSCIGMTEALR